MSVVGLKRKSRRLNGMSVLPLKSGHRLDATACPFRARSRHRLLSTGSASGLQLKLFRIHDSISAVTCAATEEARLWRA
jgi:hypothetical protein